MVWPNTEDIKIPTHYPLTADKIRFAGDAVAVVVAETREQAEDAVEAVSVRATPLPAVLDLEEAATDGVVIHEDLGTNNVVHWIHGGAGDQSVFDTAPVIVQERYSQPRLIPNAMEARGCLAHGSAAAGEFTLASATQIPHIARVGSRSRPGSRRTSCGSSRRTWAAASDRSSTSTPRRRSRSRCAASSTDL
jgi:carbon-monoxide dehydrogenase large subunit